MCIRDRHTTHHASCSATVMPAPLRRLRATVTPSSLLNGGPYQGVSQRAQSTANEHPGRRAANANELAHACEEGGTGDGRERSGHWHPAGRAGGVTVPG